MMTLPFAAPSRSRALPGACSPLEEENQPRRKLRLSRKITMLALLGATALLHVPAGAEEGPKAAEPATKAANAALDDLNRLMLKETSFNDAVAKGDIKVTGDQAKVSDLLASLDNFEFWFNIVTP